MAANTNPVREMNPSTNRSPMAAAAYPGSTPPTTARRMTMSPLAAVRRARIRCWRSSVVASGAIRRQARLATAIVPAERHAVAAGIAEPSGINRAASVHRTTPTAAVIRKAVRPARPSSPW